MSVATATTATPAAAASTARPAVPSWPSRIWVLVEALAYAGASIDPASALAARRFARVRDEELGRG